MSTAGIHLEPQLTKATPLTRNQVRGFWAAWGGWTLDGMDSFIYALVLVPSLRELLPRSGIAATKGNIGYYGGLLFALFLCGWGLAFLWGPVGDKFGRVRTLMLTIVWYSVFTFLSALVTSVWQLAVLRLLAGIGIGGEWAMGGTFVAAELAAKRRSCSLLADMETAGDTFFERNAPQNDSEFLIHVSFHLRTLGRNGVRSGRGDGACGSGWPSGAPCDATRFERHDARFSCDDSGLPGDAVACGETRTARRIGIFFRADAGLHRAHVWKGFLSRGGRAAVVLCLPFLSWLWWREFCGLYAVAAGTISDGMPGERFRVFHVLCAIWRSGDHLSGRRRGPAFSITGNSCRPDVDRVRHWSAPHSLWHGNPRADLAGVELAMNYDQYERR